MEVNEIANRLWGKIDGKTVTENRYGKGHVIWGEDVNKVLAGMKVKPDLKFKGNHRKQQSTIFTGLLIKRIYILFPTVLEGWNIMILNIDTLILFLTVMNRLNAVSG